MVQPMQIRAKFYKVGSLQYISHLDLMRTMTRSLIRAGVPAWYSQGFNPRLKITFSLPLSIGTQSECEFFDIRLIEEMPLDEIKRRVNETLTGELQITDVYQSDKKFSDIAWADYEIKMTSPKLNPMIAARMCDLYSFPLRLMKHSKSGDKIVNITPFIKLKSCIYRDGAITVRALLSADSESYLNPEYIVKALEEKLGITFDDPFSEYYTIMRKEVYLADEITPFR